MTTVNLDAVSNDVLKLINQLARDWEYSDEITPDTQLFGDLGFESIDAVILASFVQEHYGRAFPFPQFLAEVGRREVKDLSIRELSEFIFENLKSPADGARA